MDRTSFGIWSWGSLSGGDEVLGFWDGDVVFGDLKWERDSGISNGDVVLGSGTGMWVFGGSRMGMWFWGSRMGMTKKRPWRWRKRFCEPSAFCEQIANCSGHPWNSIAAQCLLWLFPGPVRH